METVSCNVNAFRNKYNQNNEKTLKTKAESQTDSTCSALHSAQPQLFLALCRAPIQGERIRFRIEPKVIQSLHLIPSLNDPKWFLRVYNIAIKVFLFCFIRQCYVLAVHLA